MISVKPTFAGEVTDLEFNIIDYLSVTYYDANSSHMDRIACTAFNSQGKPIGGGTDYVRAKIAVVTIKVPEKYVGLKNLKVKCENES
tara:strand:+ start:763 stop:1023 length:261 start_codon:yes stop_codon:yes gene_type:complete